MAVRGEGVRACEEAFERLLEGRPEVAAHVGLPRHKITAGIVSIEAGFDRGYLKKARKSHVPLIARIEALKADVETPESSAMEKYRRARNALEKAEVEAAKAKEQRDAVLSQNLMLLNQIRELEALIERYQPRLI